MHLHAGGGGRRLIQPLRVEAGCVARGEGAEGGRRRGCVGGGGLADAQTGASSAGSGVSAAATPPAPAAAAGASATVMVDTAAESAATSPAAAGAGAGPAAAAGLAAGAVAAAAMARGTARWAPVSGALAARGPRLRVAPRRWAAGWAAAATISCVMWCVVCCQAMLVPVGGRCATCDHRDCSGGGVTVTALRRRCHWHATVCAARTLAMVICQRACGDDGGAGSTTAAGVCRALIHCIGLARHCHGRPFASATVVPPSPPACAHHPYALKPSPPSTLPRLGPRWPAVGTSNPSCFIRCHG